MSNEMDILMLCYLYNLIIFIKLVVHTKMVDVLMKAAAVAVIVLLCVDECWSIGEPIGQPIGQPIGRPIGSGEFEGNSNRNTAGSQGPDGIEDSYGSSIRDPPSFFPAEPLQL